MLKQLLEDDWNNINLESFVKKNFKEDITKKQLQFGNIKCDNKNWMKFIEYVKGRNKLIEIFSVWKILAFLFSSMIFLKNTGAGALQAASEISWA